MSLRELAFDKAVKNISSFMPEIRYHFKEAVLHCERLGSNYKELEKLDMYSDIYDTVEENIKTAKAEFMEVLWGLRESIGRIEYELDPVTGGWEIMEDIFNYKKSTSDVIGDVMMELIPACHDEDSEKLNELAKWLRKMLEKIETLIYEFSQEKGEGK